MNEILKRKNIEAILITDYYNLRYLTGFTGSNGMALFTEKNQYFFTDFRYYEQADKEVKPNGFNIIKSKGKIEDDVYNILSTEKIKKIGIEDKNITLDKYNKFKNIFKNIEFYMLEDEVQKLRVIKKENEILNIKKAVEIVDNSFTEILNYIKEGVTEKELANTLEYIMKKNGADEKSFDTIVASGVRSAMPHARASDKIIEKNRFLLFDFGAYYNGYVSDMTRTVFFGKNIDEKHKKIYEIVKEAQELGLKSAKAGITTKELDGIVRDFIKSKGYGDNFGHGLGHGIGLEIHELPTVSYRTDTKLCENMVCTIEPGIYIEGFGGVRIEDDVIIKKDGCEILNKTKKDLILV